MVRESECTTCKAFTHPDDLFALCDCFECTIQTWWEFDGKFDTLKLCYDVLVSNIEHEREQVATLSMMLHDHHVQRRNPRKRPFDDRCASAASTPSEPDEATLESLSPAEPLNSGDLEALIQ